MQKELTAAIAKLGNYILIISLYVYFLYLYIYDLSTLLYFNFFFPSLNDIFFRAKKDPKGANQATVQAEEEST